MVKFADLEKEEFRRFQMKLTDMLSYLDDVCQKHGLIYYLTYGCCLGAIRHKGFIPWDDDLDIAMPRESYEKLWQIWKEETDGRYELCRTTSEQCIKFHIMLLRDPQTTCIYEHSKNEDICHGIKLDICPLDVAPDNKLLYKLQTVYCKAFGLFAAQRKPNQEKQLYRFLSKYILGIFRSQKIRTAIWQFCEKQIVKYNGTETKRIRCLHGRCFPKEVFGDGVRVPFENITAVIPAQYETYLTSIYGNYMALPPEDKRKPETVVACFDLDRSYKEYKGKEYLA